LVSVLVFEEEDFFVFVKIFPQDLFLPSSHPSSAPAISSFVGLF